MKGLLFFALFTLSTLALGQTKLPPCKGPDSNSWSMCIGTVSYPKGAKYQGEFKDGNRHGQGTFTFPDGSKYDGGWSRDTLNGQGTFTFSDGSKYIGEYKDGAPNGQGALTYPDGSKYAGEFKNDKRHGQGTFTSKSAQYVGEWKDDKRNGQGILQFSNGSKYIGEFKNDKFNGQGTVIDVKGIKRSGLWKDDKLVSEESGNKINENSLQETRTNNNSPINVVVKNEINSCNDISINDVKELIFQQLAIDGESINSLCALRNTINKNCHPADKEIYVNKWEEFKNLSKLNILGKALEEKYESPKICTMDLRLNFALSPTYFEQTKEIHATFFINKISNNSLLTFVPTSWLDIALINSLLDNSISAFRRSLLLNGFFNSENMALTKNKNINMKNLQLVLESQDDHEKFDENLDVMFNYFEKYFSPEGEFINTLNPSERIFVKKDENLDLQITTSLCPNTAIDLHRTDVMAYKNTKNQDEIIFYYYTDGGALRLDAKSKNKCIASSEKYYRTPTYK